MNQPIFHGISLVGFVDVADIFSSSTSQLHSLKGRRLGFNRGIPEGLQGYPSLKIYNTLGG